MFGKKARTYDFYLGGPMRGYPELNKKMFVLISLMLREKGFTVWSPSEHDSYLQLSFGECMTADLDAVIHKCRKIALLPGWRNSLGANMEAFSAFACGKEAVEVIPNKDKTDFDLTAVDLSQHCLPYNLYDTERIRQFNPHKCPLDSFEQE